MRLISLLAASLVPLALVSGPSKSVVPAEYVPTYTDDGRLIAPTDYRQWIYLSSGLDMSYSPRAATASGDTMSMFDNAFVTPAAWRAFQQTGTWPDKTVLLLEVRGAESKGSINKAGRFQGGPMGLEVHLKDEAQGGWAFYEFDENPQPAKMVPRTEGCYTCHQAHGAVDTTFVQFYPTLLPLAKQKGTLSAVYLKEEGK
jgi:hypothetical protein